jgi:hypothetical protein
MAVALALALAVAVAVALESAPRSRPPAASKPGQLPSPASGRSKLSSKGAVITFSDGLKAADVVGGAPAS